MACSRLYLAKELALRFIRIRLQIITARKTDRQEKDAAFGLERDLQLALRGNIDQLEAGLSIVDGDKEQTVASGRIDITARDQHGITVVIELKAGIADRDAVGQILAYVGDLMDKEPGVRGVLVAREFTPRAVSAARAAAKVRLVRCGFRFNFEIVGEPAV